MSCSLCNSHQAFSRITYCSPTYNFPHPSAGLSALFLPYSLRIVPALSLRLLTSPALSVHLHDRDLQHDVIWCAHCATAPFHSIPFLSSCLPSDFPRLPGRLSSDRRGRRATAAVLALLLLHLHTGTTRLSCPVISYAFLLLSLPL